MTRIEVPLRDTTWKFPRHRGSAATRTHLGNVAAVSSRQCAHSTFFESRVGAEPKHFN